MKKINSIFLILFLSLPIFANGDPTDVISALIGSGNPTPRKITDIQVVNEKLYIRLGYYSEFTVRYVLWNNSDKDYTNIDYAFPVDYYGGGEKYVNSDLIGDYISESRYTLGWHDNYVKKLSFYLNGETLPYKLSEEVFVKNCNEEPVDKSEYFPTKEELRNYSEKEQKEILKYAQEAYEDVLCSNKISRRWFYTQFSIKAHQAVTLDVHYTLRNYQSKHSGFYSSFFDEYNNSLCQLSYDFSPAQYWGDGKVRDFSVQIDASELAVVPDFYKDENSISVEGLPFSRTGNLYSYSGQNFSFKNAKSLEISYLLINNLPVTDLLNRIIPTDQFTISASNEQKNYPVSNLCDGDITTAWVSSIRSGIGEKITIQFKKPTDVSNLVLINGYHKNEKTYLENNRIRKIDIIAEGKIYKEDGSTEENVRNMELSWAANDKYLPVSFERLKQHPDMSSVKVSYPYESFKATKIELTIREIYRGTKYDDTCISEIILFGKD